MKPLQKITAKDIVEYEGVSIRSAYNEIKTLREFYGTKRPRFMHYLRYNDLEYCEFLEVLELMKSPKTTA